MKTAYRITLSGLTALLLTTTAIAEQATSALYSPGCDQKQLQELTGDALIKISKNQEWSNDTKGYIVTLDTDKLSFADLTQKMHQAGCFKVN